MPVYKPTELKEFLDSLGVRPNKRLSQNFLIDGNVLDKIVEFAQVKPDDLVVEIGPGPGALTERLLASGCHVIAIEKDPVFAHALNRFSSDRLTCFTGDALDFPIEKYLFKKAKVVANLPYHVTSPILERLVVMHEHISSCVVMIQDDAARRFMSAVGYVPLFLHYHAKLSFGFDVAAGSFYPRPSVGSSVIGLDLQKEQALCDEEAFFSMLHEAFIHKRKMIKSSLKAYKGIEDGLKLAGKSAESRPEELTLHDWITLFKAVCINSPFR